MIPDSLAPSIDSLLGLHSTVSSLDQLVVASLLGDQVLDRHLRRMRSTYRRRRDDFVATLAARAASLRRRRGRRPARPGPLARRRSHRGRGDGRSYGPRHRPHRLGPRLARHPAYPGVIAGYGRSPAHDARRRFEAFASLMADLTG